MREWLNRAVSKTAILERVSKVRILPPPHNNFILFIRIKLLYADTGLVPAKNHSLNYMDKSQFTKFVDDAGGIVVNKQTGNIAIIKMKHGVWGFPKGKIDKNENSLEAAKREVYEETGVKEVELVKQLPTYQRPNSGNPQILITMYMYLFKTNTNELKPIDDQDAVEAKWVKKEDVIKILTLSKDKEYFEQIKNEI